MKRYSIFLACISLFFLLSACNGTDRFAVLKKCTVLGDESIVYARAHYVKLFHHFNPNRFADSYRKVGNFDAVTHRNTINTYERAIQKEKSDEKVTQNLITSCKSLATFSQNFVDQTYPLAIKHRSDHNPLSDAFFMEINRIVKFDDNLGMFDTSKKSFKESVSDYQNAVIEYIQHFRKYIPSDFANQRLKK